MEYSLEFEIPLFAIAFGPNDRVHWSTRARRNANVREITKLRGVAAQRSTKGVGYGFTKGNRATLKYIVTWAKGKRRLNDADNLIAQLKPCTDGLKDAGLIHDDSPDWLTLLPVEQRKGSQAMISIQIELTWLRTLSGNKGENPQ